MDMTGLSTRGAKPTATTQSGPANNEIGAAIRRWYAENPRGNSQYGADFYRGRFPGQFWRSRMHGGDTMEGEYYVVNEVGPEDRFEGGKVIRNSMPTYTMPDGPGYVKPTGKFMGGMYRGDTPAWHGTGTPYLEYPDGSNYHPTRQRYHRNSPYTGPGKDTRLPSPSPSANVPGAVPENPGGVEGGYTFTADPGYNFRFNEGMRAIERGASARK